MKTKLSRFWILALLSLCGCVSNKWALQKDFKNYSDVYGDAVNRQLLLNLARERNQEPVYFIQLAQISSQYQFNAQASFTPVWSHNSPGANVNGAVQRTLGLQGTVNGGVMATPIFQFLPLAGSNFVQTLLAPISPNIFWTFYDQGWPADLVARTMVNSIQKRIPDELDTNHFRIEIYINDPTDPTYPIFLKYCNDLYHAQQFHILEVNETNSGAGAPGSIVFQLTNEPPGQALAAAQLRAAPLRDVVSAISAGLTVTDTNGLVVTKKKENTFNKFFTKTNVDEQITNFLTYLGYVQPSNGASSCAFQLTNNAVLTAKNWENALSAASNAIAFATDIEAKRITFTTRNYEAALNAVANEQELFQSYEKDGPKFYQPDCAITFTNDPYGTIAMVDNWSGPAFTVRPILTTQYGEYAAHLSPMVSINYEGQNYTVGDLREDGHDPQEPLMAQYFGYKDNLDRETYQNHMVFTMLCYLFTETAVDTSKLPVQQLIQVQ